MNWSETTVTVTGAAGFIGSHLTEALVSKGADVRAVDKKAEADREFLESVRDEVAVIHQDIRDADFTIDAETDVVFHLAAIANPRTCQDDFDTGFSVNVEGTKQVLRAARASDCERVVVASSAAVYGDPEYLPIDEEHPLNGNDPYARTKQMVETLVATYAENYDLNVTATRNFNVFGPRHDKSYLIPTLIYQALKEDKIEIWTKDSSRDFTYIDDMVSALFAVAENDELIGESVNIGTGNEWTSGELAELISERFGGVEVIDLEKETAGSDRLVCENTKLKDTTGWEPEVSFEDGLSLTVDWYREYWSE